jgi:crossover junction endodeoxyribonuclease RusA
MFEVTLPWPPKALNPNARVHWSAKSKSAKAYRVTCFALCIEAKTPKIKDEGPIHLSIEFIEPDERHRDLDNMLASIKNGLDGIADALGVNDKRFHLSIRRSESIGGMVKVVIS